MPRRVGFVILIAAFVFLTSGLNLSQVPVALAGAMQPTGPQLVIVNDGTDTVERLAHQQYQDDRKFDRDLDRIGKDISTSTEELTGGNLSSVATLRMKAKLSSLNSALLVPCQVAESNQDVVDLAKTLLGTGKFVYVYGPGVTPESVGALLGVNLTGLKANADPEDVVKRAEGIPAQSQNYSVIGVATSEKGMQTRFGATNTTNPALLREDALRWVIEWELDRPNHVKSDRLSLRGGVAEAAYTLVTSWTSHGTTWYEPSTGQIRGSIVVDWYLEKRTDETDPTYDYFAVDPRYEVKDGAYLQGNPYMLTSFVAKHSKFYTADNIYDWSPSSGSTNSFSVNLATLTVSWSFTMGRSHNLTTQADQNADWASFLFAPTFPAVIDMPLHVRPGTGWGSTGTFFYVTTHHEATFKNIYGTQWVEQWDDSLTYDY